MRSYFSVVPATHTIAVSCQLSGSFYDSERKHERNSCEAVLHLAMGCSKDSNLTATDQCCLDGLRDFLHRCVVSKSTTGLSYVYLSPSTGISLVFVQVCGDISSAFSDVHDAFVALSQWWLDRIGDSTQVV